MKLTSEHPPLGTEHSEKVPYAKKPKVRPPRGWRDKVIFPGLVPVRDRAGTTLTVTAPVLCAADIELDRDVTFGPPASLLAQGTLAGDGNPLGCRTAIVEG